MAGVLATDTSMYNTVAPPAQQDPLAMIGKVLNIQGAQQQLQNQQMEFKARQALGPIIQQSIGPDGELDVNKFLLHGAANPDVAWKMPEITLQMIQRQNTQADTVNKVLQANTTRYKAMGDAAGSLLAEAEGTNPTVDIKTGQPGLPGISSKQLVSTLSTLVGENGLIDAKDAAELAAKTASMSPQQRYQFVKNFANSANGITETMKGIYGAVNPVAAGGKTSMTQSNPLLRSSNVLGDVEHVPTPAERNAGVETVVPGGAKVLQPRSAVAPMSGGLGSSAPGSPGSGQAPIVAQSPMDTKLQEDRAKGAVEFENDLSTANITGQENLRVLREMQDALKEFKAGGGMEVRQKLAQMADGMGMPKTVVDGLAGGNRGAVAEFQKLAVRYATQEMKTNMGQSQRFTNLDFNTFLKNNPTIDTDPRGLDKMFKFLEQGVWRAGQQQRAYQAWKEGQRPGKFKDSDISSFPAYWTEVLNEANKPRESK